MNDFDVICVGNSAVDVPLQPVEPNVFAVDSYPVDRIVPTVGGSGTNVSIILSRLGVPTKLITMLGQDMLGDFLVEHCERNGVDTSGILRNGNVDTPLSVGLVRADGERSFVVSRSSSTFHFGVDDMNLNALKGAKLLAVASIFIMPKFDDFGLTRLFSAAKQEGLIICADMMKSRTGERLSAVEHALSYVDYFFANYEEAAFLTELTDLAEIGDRMLSAGVKNVIIKRGREGCYLQNKEGAQYFPAYVTKPVDTIGAGDNFAAGFIAALLEGRALGDCAAFANAVAAVSVRAVGSTGGVQSVGQVMDFMNREMR